MALFKIQNLLDNSETEIIAMNIDKENNILRSEDNNLGVLSIEDFKEMVLGGMNGEKPTHVRI